MLDSRAKVGYNTTLYLLEKGVLTQRQAFKKLLSSQMLKLIKKRKMEKFRQHAIKSTTLYPLSLDPGFMIGVFEMCFKKESSFQYRVHNQPINAFFIRRSNWIEIENQAS